MADRILYFSDVAALANEFGMRNRRGKEISRIDVRNWHIHNDRMKIPFFKDPGGRIAIMESAFRRWLLAKQNDAINAIEAPKRRAGAR
jgi:hypothetical protein